MKQIRLFIASVSLAICFITNACSQPGTSADGILGVFVASTPCGEKSKPLPGIPVNADCEFIKWRLTLYQNKAGEPTTYKLSYKWGLTLPNTTGFTGGGKAIEMEGKWSIVKGMASNDQATVYQLAIDGSAQSISFVKFTEDLLHLLDIEKRLMIGNPGWSFTLNKLK